MHMVEPVPIVYATHVKKAVPWNNGNGEYIRSGKYLEGEQASWETVVDVTQTRWLRIAQALGLPVVPDVKMRAQTSAGVAFAAGVIVVGTGRSWIVRLVMAGLSMGAIWENACRLRLKWR
jgi:hypothetical protein